LFAIIDACAFINLIGACDDDKYLDFLEYEFKKIFVAKDKVADEIQDNMFKNFLNLESSRREEIEEIIYQRVRAKYICWEDTKDCQDFLSQITQYPKRNGEFFSVALSLYLSRVGGEGKELCEKLFAVHLVTDDLGISNDFGEFFRINQIGNILDTIDIVTFLYLRERITKGDLENYCISLKSLYSRALAELEAQLEKIRQHEKDVKLISFFSEIMNILQYDNTEPLDQKWKDFTRENSSIHRRAKQKYSNFFNLVEDYITDGSLNQIARIEERRKQIVHIWKL